MWAYSRYLNLTAVRRSFVLSSVCQKSPVTKCALSTAPLQTMYVSARRRLFLTAVFRVCAQGKILKKGIHLSQLTRRAVETNQAKDVVIFKYDNQRLHRTITVFGIVNYFMFMSISINIYTLLTSPSKGEGQETSEFDSESGSSLSPMNSEANTSSTINPEAAEGSEEFKLSISSTFALKALCGVTFVLGCIMLVGSWLYCNNVVRFIVLRKGGQKVTVVTHGFFAMNRFYTWDIDKVSCRGNRAISSAVLLNAKGKYFSYMLDKKGTYTNPQLFDATVGVLRDLRN